MARIAGVDIPKDKKVAYSLRYVHGIGLKTALDICEQAKVDPNTRVTDLSSNQEDEIRKVIVDLKLLIEGELRSENLKNVKRTYFADFQSRVCNKFTFSKICSQYSN